VKAEYLRITVAVQCLFQSRVIPCQVIQAMQPILSDFDEISQAFRTYSPDQKELIFLKTGQTQPKLQAFEDCQFLYSLKCNSLMNFS